MASESHGPFFYALSIVKKTVLGLLPANFVTEAALTRCIILLH